MQKVKIFLLVLVCVPLCCFIFIIARQTFTTYYYGYKEIALHNTQSLFTIVKDSSVISVDYIYANRNDSLFFLSCRGKNKLIVWKFNRYNNLSLSNIFFSQNQNKKEDLITYDQLTMPNPRILIESKSKASSVNSLYLKLFADKLLDQINNQNYFFYTAMHFGGIQFGNENKNLEAALICFFANNSANILICKKNNSLYLIILLSEKTLNKELLNNVTL